VFASVKGVREELAEEDDVAEPAVPTELLTRRDRVRAATVTEIKRTARRLLVERGAEGLSLRAIAREMGMTAPGLYRYFPSRDDLMVHVIADLYDELSDALERERDRLPADDIAGRLMAACRTFRSWAFGHGAEFALLFGSPIGGVNPIHHAGESPREGPAHEAGRRFGGVFAALIAELYLRRPFPVQSERDLDPALADQLRAWCEEFPAPLPLGVMYVFLSCWIRLYGTVCMEVFGHLKFAVDDAEPTFEAELRDMAGLLGIAEQYRPPAGRRV
jgi:AcrR family transcriptional regulator